MNDLSQRIAECEVLGLVGESGSGKTMLPLALMGLLLSGALFAIAFGTFAAYPAVRVGLAFALS